MTTPNPPRTAETVAGELRAGFSSLALNNEAADLITSLQVQVEALSGVLGEARMVVDRIADCPPDDRARVRRVVEDARLVRHKLALPAPAKGGE